MFMIEIEAAGSLRILQADSPREALQAATRAFHQFTWNVEVEIIGKLSGEVELSLKREEGQQLPPEISHDFLTTLAWG